MPPLSKVKLGFQSILQYLGEIDILFQCGSIQPGGKGNSTVDGAVDMSLADGWHIDVN